MQILLLSSEVWTIALVSHLQLWTFKRNYHLWLPSSPSSKVRDEKIQWNISGNLYSRGEANVPRITSWQKWIKFPKQINRQRTCELLWGKKKKKKKVTRWLLIPVNNRITVHTTVCAPQRSCCLWLHTALQHWHLFTNWLIRPRSLQVLLHQSKCPNCLVHGDHTWTQKLLFTCVI